MGVVALLAVACGQATATLDTTQVENSIVQTILKQRGINTVVHCPSNAPLRTGYRFQCTAALDVGSYPLNVVERNANGGVSYANSKPLLILNSHTVALAIQYEIQRKKHLRSTVSCPKSILQAKGLTFTCTAKTKLGTGPFLVTEDNGSHVTFKGL